MSSELNKAYRDESVAAMHLHADMREYVEGDLKAWEFLDAAFKYGKARLERECLHDELFGEP